MSQAKSPLQVSPPDSPRCTEAPHPFNLSSADLILRTADLVDFRVHSLLLALVSPFFATMLSLPQPPGASSSSACPSCAAQGANAGPAAPPVVLVPEDSATLELLLRLVYPILKTHAQIEDPQVLVPALLAATKYEMELPVQMLSERLIAITPKQPLQVWAAACRTGQESVARPAAEALKASWTRAEAEGTDPQPEALASLVDGLGNMEGISAGDYYRLKQFLRSDNTCISAPLLSPPPDASPRCPPLLALFSTNLPSIDVTCRSRSATDPEVQFPAHQLVLSAQSAVLRARLAESRGTTESKGPSAAAQTVLDFDEGPEVVSTLLTACYGGDGGLPTDLDRLADLYVASQKYKMARMVREVRTAWDEAAALAPLEAYFVAVNHGLSECAKVAAKNVLTGPIVDAYATVMDSAPALAYHRLLVYYDACRHAASEQVNEVGRQMHSIDINRYRIYASQVNAVITKAFTTGTTLKPGNGKWRSELYSDLERMSYGFTDIRPFMEWAISLPDTISSTIDEIRIETD